MDGGRTCLALGSEEWAARQAGKLCLKDVALGCLPLAAVPSYQSWSKRSSGLWKEYRDVYPNFLGEGSFPKAMGGPLFPQKRKRARVLEHFLDCLQVFLQPGGF
jgi:hypothetical protein